MSNLSVFEFESNQVRVILIDGEPWFVAKDLCAVLDLEQVSRAVSRLDEDEKGVTIVNTPGGNQEMVMVSESGMYSLVLTSRKDEAKIFKRWLTNKVLPQIRKTGMYAPAMSQSEIILAIAQQHVDFERRQKALEESQQAIVKQISSVELQVTRINQRAEAAEQELKSLPAPSKTASPRTTRANINSLVRTYCHCNSISHSDAYKNLYREFRDRYHVDLKVRAANGKSAPLDIAESLDVLDDLYALASELFGGA